MSSLTADPYLKNIVHFFIRPLNQYVKHFYDNYIEMTGYDEDSNSLKLVIPETVMMKSHSTRVISLKIIVSAYLKRSGDTVDEKNRVPFWILPDNSLEDTPLRVSNGINIIDKTFGGIITFSIDNISNHEYELRKGKVLFKLCGPCLQNVEYSVKNEMALI